VSRHAVLPLPGVTRLDLVDAMGVADFVESHAAAR
jgi:hypothetical protein